MRIRIARFAAAAAVVALAIAPRAAHAQDLGIQVGTKAPSTTVYTLDGQKTDLSAYVGKTPTLIEFWATWCPNCKELEPTMKAAEQKFGSKVKFVRVAVSVNESPARVKAYVAKYGVPGIHYFDTDGDASSAYDAPATSYVVILDKTGTVVYTGLGGKQDIDAALKNVL
jgi:thiol-disulfide isomerase/thioredoxin